MKKIYVFIVLGLWFTGCHDDDSVSEADTYSYTYTENSDLIISSREDTYMEYGQVENGNNLVFEYMFDTYTDENIADDGYTEIIKFEIDSELEEFSYSGDELSTLEIVFTKICFCHFPKESEDDFAPRGTISGEKISDTEWLIHLDITFYENDSKVIHDVFTMQ